jgi:ketosteroid isomerase-like protein
MFETCQMQIKTTLVPAVLFLALLAGCAGPPKHPTWNNATGSEQHERLMWDAIKAQQWKDVESHLSPTFVGVDAAGKKYDRAGWLASWKSSGIGEFSLGEVTVDPAGTDMVVSYILNISGNVSGSVASKQTLRVVSVWQQVKSGWIMTATSLTPIKE